MFFKLFRWSRAEAPRYFPAHGLKNLRIWVLQNDFLIEVLSKVGSLGSR